MMEMLNSIREPRVMIMGDFNIPSIDWESLTGHNGRDEQCIEIRQDNFWIAPR